MADQREGEMVVTDPNHITGLDLRAVQGDIENLETTTAGHIITIRQAGLSGTFRVHIDKINEDGGTVPGIRLELSEAAELKTFLSGLIL